VPNYPLNVPPPRDQSNDASYRGEIPAKSVDINGDVSFFRGLGFRVEEIFPADAPARAVVSGHGLRLHLLPDAEPVRLRLVSDDDIDAATLVSPGGTTVDMSSSIVVLAAPLLRSELIVSRLNPEETPHAGRAGMRYRDLVPGRQGDCVIASLISIPYAGPVNDWVHFHEIRFQLIFVKAGWVRVVYEDQGEPFVMHTGDCVIQPPTIRHRVLENSDNLEVVEIGFPAEDVTRADPNLELPNGNGDDSREWSGQTFIRHVEAHALWTEFAPGVQRTDTGVHGATQGLAAVDVIRSSGAASFECDPVTQGFFEFLITLAGSMTVTTSGREETLVSGESIVVPVGHGYRVGLHEDSRILRVRIDTLQ